MTDKMLELLNNCFDARIRELNALKSITKETTDIDKEIEVVESLKKLQANDMLFKI